MIIQYDIFNKNLSFCYLDNKFMYTYDLVSSLCFIDIFIFIIIIIFPFFY